MKKSKESSWVPVEIAELSKCFAPTENFDPFTLAYIFFWVLFNFPPRRDSKKGKLYSSGNTKMADQIHHRRKPFQTGMKVISALKKQVL